ncbi:tetratricopeptide repeat protein [Compostibacter hankyongensis]|uniref:Tetratricopeptide repeat protein n=1 Tax=Compostibacter hankyongensis TaxID=1007089 RepID=A0ABP8FG17_9BACT
MRFYRWEKAGCTVLFTMMISLSLSAQTGTYTGGSNGADELFATARKFISNGDYSNAILVLNRAIEQDPQNLEYRKQLAFTYFLRRDLGRADQLIRELLGRDDADVQTYQIAGNIYQAQRDSKKAERNYKRGLRKFPNSGELNNELGLLYFNEQNYTDALRCWTKGIRVAPSYPGNYYNAARTYYYSKDKFWAIIYGEIFINLERMSTRTAEMRGILLESYKYLFNNPDALSVELPPLQNASGDAAAGQQPSGEALSFRKAILNTLAKSATVITRGITPETLIMLRTRFILDWTRFYSLYYPYALFDFQRQLLKDGLFEAYNQWIFGPAANQAAYRTWTGLHKAEYDRLMKYLQENSLQPRAGEFYQNEKIDYEADNNT